MQLIFLPFISRTRFCELVGITDDVLAGWIRRGYIKTTKVGKRSMVDLTSYLPEGQKNG